MLKSKLGLAGNVPMIHGLSRSDRLIQHLMVSGMANNVWIHSMAKNTIVNMLVAMAIVEEATNVTIS